SRRDQALQRRVDLLHAAFERLLQPRTELDGRHLRFASSLASNGCACSFAPCFIKISTLPSACSNSPRQEFESFMPSSNNASDCSSGKSPFSSWSTISSRRFKQSS